MRILSFTIFIILLLVQPAFADEIATVKKNAEKRINAVIDHIRDKNFDKKTRNEKIIAAISPMFDFSQMAKLSMGKKNWSRMNPPQRQEFNELFVIRLQESYLEKLDLYTDEEVVVEQAELVKKRIHVRSHLVANDDKIEMIYKFYKKRDQGWKVYDVEILGVSIVQTYRSQFAGILKNQTIDDLLKKLRQTGGFTVPTGKY
jgi:phospholipid transport system substrate-binding protein